MVSAHPLYKSSLFGKFHSSQSCPNITLILFWLRFCTDSAFSFFCFCIFRLIVMASSSRLVLCTSSRPLISSPIDKVADINPSKETWRIRVRIIRLWNIPSYAQGGLPYSLEMVLLDENGGKIHASVRKTLVFKFFNMLKEGKFVLQNLMYATKVFYNLDVPVALEMKNSFDDWPNLLNNLVGSNCYGIDSKFLSDCERKTIEELKDCRQDCICVVLATVNQF